MTISSQADLVVFNSKTIEVSNTPIVGNITYGESKTPVGVGYNVSFYDKASSKRIYTSTINVAGIGYCLSIKKLAKTAVEAYFNGRFWYNCHGLTGLNAQKR